MEDSPLSDLSFFKFPELTGHTVTNIVALFFLLALVVIATVIVQRRLQRRYNLKERREAFEHAAAEGRLPAHVREIMERLLKLSPHRDPFDLFRDAEAFEQAVQQFYDSDPEADFQAVASMRRVFHLNVMNPNLTLVSTRQLLADLPVRVIAKVGVETLDLYCALQDVNEAFLLIDVPEEEDIRSMLRESPRTQLIFWREHDGETVFDVKLEFAPAGGITLIRAAHAFRSAEASQRTDFRLTVDFPLTYVYIEREKLGNVRAGGPHVDLVKEEGRLIDLSYGGAAFTAPMALEPEGFAQLRFTIHEDPVHMMLEVLDRDRAEDGTWIHRGRFRGMSQDAKNRIYRHLSREQVVRLREKEAFRKKPGE